MAQKRRNVQLMFILVLLIITSLLISVLNNDQSSGIEHANKFQLVDTANVDRIEIQSDNLNNTLTKTDSGWTINEKYNADKNILRVLLSIMKQVKTSREIADSQEDDIIDQLKKSGIEVKFYENEKVVESFIAGGNDTKTQSYFMDNNNNVYIVNLEGYDSFVSGIFEIPENDWRKRLLFKTSLTSLISIEVTYNKAQREGFKLVSSGNFFNVESLQVTDTSKALDYAQQFEHFQADQYYLPGTNATYDSLINTGPYCSITITDVKYPDGKTLQFYKKLKNENVMLAQFTENKIPIFSYRRIAGIFRDKDWFIPNNDNNRSSLPVEQ